MTDTAARPHAFRRLRRGAAAAVAVAGLVALAACTSDPTSASGGTGSASDTLSVYLYQKPKVFSPLATANGPDQIVMSLVFDSLLAPDQDFTLQPHLAAALPTLSADSTTYTFKLRPGLKWSDGKPFTSKDVLFTYNLLANPASGSATSGNYATVEGYDAVKAGTAKTLTGFSAPDDNTFVIRSSKPNAGLTATIGSVPILPEHVLGSVPLDRLDTHPFFNQPTVGLGPYTFKTYKTDQYVELTANRAYRSKVNIGTILLKPLTSDVATAQLGTGELDIAQVLPVDAPTVQKMSGVSVDGKDSAGFVRIAVNQAKPMFKDARVRQAFLYAVDRQKLVDKVLSGKGKVINSAIDPEAAGLQPYAYDPAKAKALLQAAGWKSGTTVTLAWVPGQRDRDTSAAIVQSQLKDVGVNVVLKQVEAAQLVDSYKSHSFDMVLYGGGNYAVDPFQTFTILACSQAFPNGGNIPPFCNPQLDSLLTQANGLADPAARKGLYDKAAAIENQSAAYLWLYSPQILWAHRSRVKGFVPSGDFTAPFLDVATWSLS